MLVLNRSLAQVWMLGLVLVTILVFLVVLVVIVIVMLVGIVVVGHCGLLGCCEGDHCGGGCRGN